MKILSYMKNSWETGDLVKCLDCGNILLLPLGAEKCPICNKDQLLWYKEYEPEYTEETVYALGKNIERKQWYTNSNLLSERIFDCLSDGYDDEEFREENINDLYNEISQLDGNSTLRAVLSALCDRVEELL